MPTTQVCPECGSPLPEDRTSCPTCALRGALALSPRNSEAVITERLGDRIGPYKLIEQIGEGGYGVVYLAEQTEPIRRRVALKIVKLGMDTQQVLNRFEAERQALGLMGHPNIARVLEAGATSTGRPFFVMELVRGIKITAFCDQHRLSTRERLNLFTQVCQAVQHAHQRGIIHRDLKPSNILVEWSDGEPIPKVIDFGIAKATLQPLTERTPLTSLHQFLGTPAYMSPEQAGTSGADVDARSDIYVLGVLLYELLTGKTPFDAPRLLETSLDEIRRIIREEDPPRPSTRLTTLAAAEQTTVAMQRQSEPPKLLRMIRGDLDWIVMKCLEKDRARRYDSASALANDLQHFLNHEPVSAVAPSATYRIRKFIHRHPFELTTAAALSLLLLGVLPFAVWQVARAKEAERKAIVVAAFWKDVLNGVRPSVALGRDTTLLRETLDRAAKRLDLTLKDQPEVQAELSDAIGNLYEEIGVLSEAEAMRRRAFEIRRSVHGGK